MKKMRMPSEVEMQEMFAISVIKQKISNSVDSVLQSSGMIIAASLSVIIFLLSFTENRTIVLEIGIFCLVLSIIFQFELYMEISKFNVKKDIKIKFSTLVTKRLVFDFLNLIGASFFFIGILYLITFFKLFFLVLILVSYLNISWVRGVIRSLTVELRKKTYKKMEIQREILKKLIRSSLFTFIVKIFNTALIISSSILIFYLL